MIVTDILWKNKSGELKRGYGLENYLVENMSGIPSFLKKGWDVVGIVSGHGNVRTGKTFQKETKVKIVNEKGEVIDSKPIGEYKDGEILNTLSWDFNKAKMVGSKSEVIKEEDKKGLFTVELENGKKITCSMDHKLFVKRKFCGTDNKLVWKIVELKLKYIKEGDELVCLL